MAWTLDALSRTLDRLRRYGSETPNIEVKRAAQGYPQSTAETLCAFSNMPEGGTIIFGIDEAQGFTPVGVYDIAELEQSISSTLRNALDPKGQAAFTRLRLGTKDILIADVAPLPSYARPCYYRGRAYMRHSDGDYAMDDYEITRVLAHREHTRHDLTAVPGSTADHLDSDYTQKFVAAAGRTSSRLRDLAEEAVLTRKSVLTAGTLTLAGLYALGDYPQQFYPSLKISGVLESDTARNLDKLETDGPLPEMLDHAVSWLARNLRTAVVEDGSGGLVDRPEIPLVALRELVANALVHRALDPDTSYSKDIVIRIGRDRITITNPGGLWAMTTANLAEPGYKTAVNPALYEICKLAQTPGGSRVIEGEGNGIYEAQKAMREAGLPPIEFINKGFQFTAIIRRADPQAEPSPSVLSVEQATHELLYSYLRESGQRTVPQMIDATGLTRRQVTYNLRKLQQDGRVGSLDEPGKYGARYRVLV